MQNLYFLLKIFPVFGFGAMHSHEMIILIITLFYYVLYRPYEPQLIPESRRASVNRLQNAEDTS
jgi:hypothetical protein